jgi:hypothetical protein
VEFEVNNLGCRIHLEYIYLESRLDLSRKRFNCTGFIKKQNWIHLECIYLYWIYLESKLDLSRKYFTRLDFSRKACQVKDFGHTGFKRIFNCNGFI